MKCNQRPFSPTDSAVIKQRQLLKNVAFCTCLRAVYPADSALKNDGSLGGYSQTVSYGTNTILAINDAAKTYVEKAKEQYRSIEGRPLGMMKCLDWYNSKELDSLIRKYDQDIIFYPPLDSIKRRK